MNGSLTAILLEHYQWQLAIIAAVSVVALTALSKQVLLLVPTFKSASRLNGDALRKKMERPSYAANRRTNRKEARCTGLSSSAWCCPSA